MIGGDPSGREGIGKKNRHNDRCVRVGVRSVLPPETGLQVGDKLGAEVAHLGTQLGALLAVVLEFGYQFGVQHYHRFTHQHPVFRASEADNIHTAVGSHLLERFAELHRCVGNTRTIHMQVHAVRVDEVGDGADLLAGIDRAKFRTLRDIDGFGLRMVLEAPVGEVRADELRRQLAVGRGDGHQRGAGHEGGRAALIDGYVGGFGAEDAVEGPHAGPLCDHVGAGAVENGEHLRRIAELLFENLPHTGGVGVVAVGNLMVCVARGNCL